MTRRITGRFLEERFLVEIPGRVFYGIPVVIFEEEFLLQSLYEFLEEFLVESKEKKINWKS